LIGVLTILSKNLQLHYPTSGGKTLLTAWYKYMRGEKSPLFTFNYRMKKINGG